MFKLFGVCCQRQLSKSAVIRLSLTFLILSAQAFAKPVPQRSKVEYSEFVRQAKPTGGGYRSVKIMDTVEGEERALTEEVEELDPKGFIPDLNVKPTINQKPILRTFIEGRNILDNEEILKKLQNKKKLITNIKSGVQKQIVNTVAKRLDGAPDEKERMGLAELLFNVVRLLMERRPLVR